MKAIQKYLIIALSLIVAGCFLVYVGGLEVSEARETENAMLLAEGFNHEFGGINLMMVSLILMIFVWCNIQIEKLRKEWHEETKKTDFSHNIEDDVS